MLTPESLFLPAEIAHPLEGAALHQVSIGMSDADVYRALAAGQATRYLKVTSGEAAEELAAEGERLAWLRGWLPVPEVLASIRVNARAYLLLSEVPGLMACDPALAMDPRALAHLLGVGLRQIHAVPIADCPFDMRLDRRLVEAERCMRAGLADEEDFDECRQGMLAEALFEQLLRERPADEDIVFTHGDYCLPNVLIDPQQHLITGYIDVGRAGVADRYQDLALAVRSIAYNFGSESELLLREFWEAYEIEHPDLAQVAYHQLLDEFF